MNEDAKIAGKEAAKILNNKKISELDTKISIVIAVLDSLNYTKDCVDSLAKHAPNAEIIIINNGSQVETKEYLDSLKHIQVIHWEENLGVSKAWNAGLKLATRDVLCVLNNDVLIQFNGIQRLVQAALENGIAAAEGACMNMDFSYAYSTYNEDEADYLGGYCLVFKREVLENVGEFDEMFSPAYWEDNDWGLRVKEAGYKWRIIQGCVFHYVARTSTRVLDMGALFAKQREKFINKWGHKALGLGERILIRCEKNNNAEIQNCINELRQRKPMSKIQILTGADTSSLHGYDCASDERQFREYTQEIDCTEYLNRALVSFITWVNDEVQYRSFLKSSHNIKAEYIKLGQEYDSLSKAYNAGTDVAKGKYLAYVHQDVEILDTFFEAKVAKVFESRDDIGFVGVIGSVTKDNTKSLWFHEGAHRCRGLAIQNRYEAVNVCVYNGPACLIDGLLMIADKKFNFPESLPHIHFVDAWICNVASEAGYQNWITDILVNHNSAGETKSTFFKDNLVRYRIKWFSSAALSDTSLDINSVFDRIKKPQLEIGIAITTRNRPEMLDVCLMHFKTYTDENVFGNIIIYDDASDYAQKLENQKIVKKYGLEKQYYTSAQQVGIAQAKNSCFYLLGERDYYFLFDDDTFPIKSGWVELYKNASIQSGFQHLLYGNDTWNTISDKTDGIEFYDRPWGVLLFSTKAVYQKLGGYRKEFGLYGAEHTDYTIRAGEAGFTNLTKLYAGPSDCVDYIWNIDTEAPSQKTICKTPSHEESITRHAKNVAVEIAHNVAETTERQIYYPIVIDHEITGII